MITFLEGSIVSKAPTRVVMDLGGVGYEVFIPLSSFDRLPGKGEVCRLLIYDHIREDAHHLYGFATEAERQLFGMLLSVSGIGPKLALSALSGITVRELKTAVVEGDVNRLSSVSGIGKKTAERIVVELRHRLGVGESMEALAGERDAAEADTRTRDAILALVSLGYKQGEAQKVVRASMSKQKGDVTVEEIVRAALVG